MSDTYYANGNEVKLFEQAYSRKVPVMLTGPTGCGKTRLVEEFCEHYTVAVLPARPARPTDKPKVEVAVQIVQRWVLARLRNRQFFSLQELNVAIAELLGAEGAAYGIRANAICPGNTLPGMAGDDPAGWRATASGAFATSDDVAAAVAFLASPDAAHVNGATLRIDGGTGAALQMVTRA